MKEIADEPVQYVDPASVRGLLRSYRRNQIDFDQLAKAFIDRCRKLLAEPEDSENHDESSGDYFNDAEEIPDDDSPWWVNSARMRGTLTSEQEDFLLKEYIREFG